MKKLHIMVDTEFLSPEPNAALVSIGAVEFNPYTGTLGREFYTRVSAKDCCRRGMSLDPDTVMWWTEQAESVRKELYEPGAPDLADALSHFRDYIIYLSEAVPPSDVYLWCHNVVDEVKLRKACEIASVKVPWKRRKVIDLWTLKSLVELVTGGTFVKPERTEGVAHNALDDAKHQCGYASDMYNLLRPEPIPYPI